MFNVCECEEWVKFPNSSHTVHSWQRSEAGRFPSTDFEDCIRNCFYLWERLIVLLPLEREEGRGSKRNFHARPHRLSYPVIFLLSSVDLGPLLSVCSYPETYQKSSWRGCRSSNTEDGCRLLMNVVACFALEYHLHHNYGHNFQGECVHGQVWRCHSFLLCKFPKTCPHRDRYMEKHSGHVDKTPVTNHNPGRHDFEGMEDALLKGSPKRCFELKPRHFPILCKARFRMWQQVETWYP